MTRAIVFDLYGVLALNGWQAFKAAHFKDREDVWDQVFQLGRQVDARLRDYADLITFTAEQTGESEATVRYQLEHTVVNRELLDFIRADLKGRYRLGILSNASRDGVIEQLFSPKDRALFDAIITSREVGLAKPDSRMYELVANKLGVEPMECLYVDDQERHAAGARDAGMHPFVYTDVAALKEKIGTLS